MLLTQLIKSFEPHKLSNQELIEQCYKMGEQIILLPEDEQVTYWEFIGEKLSEEQKSTISMALNSLLKTDEQKESFARGIILIDNDIIEFEQSIATLQKIKEPNDAVKAAIKAMQELSQEINKSHKKTSKKKIN